MDRERHLAETFVELADTLVDDFDVIDFLQGLATRCVELLDVAAAGIVLADQGGSLRTVAASDERARLLELFEVQNDEGPCRDCYQLGAAVVNVNLDGAGPLAAFHPPRDRRRLPVGERPAAAAPQPGDRLAQPVSCRHRRPSQRGASDGAGTGRCRHDRHPAAAHRPARRGRRRTAPVALTSRIVIEQAKGGYK